MTKICVFGAGAIGGYVGARLAHKAEADVSLVARGPHLAAMEANGLVLKQGGETFAVRPRVMPIMRVSIVRRRQEPARRLR